MFVVFEGIDGSGKTTISNRVVARLRASGLSVEHVRAEGKLASSVSEAIRTLARDNRNVALTPRAEFLLYVARDVQMIDEVIRPALASYDVVVADRFLATAEVLARFGRGLPAEYVKPIVAAAAQGIEPDLVVLIDVDPALARARRKVSKIVQPDTRAPSRKGLSGTALQRRMRSAYLSVASTKPAQWRVVANESSLDEAVEAVVALVTRGAPDTASVRPSSAPIGTPADALARYRRWIEERAVHEPAVAAYLLAGLSGAPLDPVRSMLVERVPEVMLAGIGGMVDAVSWGMRERYAAKHPVAVAKSLTGVAADDALARALRELLWPHARSEVLQSLTGRDDDESWGYRTAIANRADHGLMRSLAGIDSPRAWDLRDAWLQQHRSQLAHQYESAKALAKSLQGLDDDRAWALREAVREVAPVAFLSSLQACTSERSFAARESFLSCAPKAVMQSLRGLDLEPAWALRCRIAAHTKEALDGMRGLDADPAWQLREQYADQWPSTVVKSLGALADTPRGGQLTSRILARHGDDLSLLRHAAAIALGCHRVRFDPE